MRSEKFKKNLLNNWRVIENEVKNGKVIEIIYKWYLPHFHDELLKAKKLINEYRNDFPNVYEYLSNIK